MALKHPEGPKPPDRPLAPQSIFRLETEGIPRHRLLATSCHRTSRTRSFMTI